MSLKSKRKSAASVDIAPHAAKRIENSWLMLLKDTLLENNNFDLITLPHPSDGNPSKYCLDDQNKKIYEIVSCDEPYRSWFLGETVKSDGGLLMVTLMNPIYLVLPKLKELCADRAIPLDDLLSDKGFNKIKDFVNSLDEVADLKGPSDLKAYKYNEEKTLSWLEERVFRLSKILRKMNVHVTPGAVSATFVTSNISNESIDEEFYLKYAHGMISEYIQEDLANKLESKFNFKPELVESLIKKRKSEVVESDGNARKKVKNETQDQKENKLSSFNTTFEEKKQKPLSTKEKAMQKAASGSKTISAFFTKK